MTLTSRVLADVAFYALAIIDACHVLDPSSEWAHKVCLKWPNVIYGLFPSSQSSWASNSKSTPELRKIGMILVNTNFSSGVADVVIGTIPSSLFVSMTGKVTQTHQWKSTGSSLNVLNAPPIPSLVQLASTHTIGLPIEHIVAAILTSFEHVKFFFCRMRNRGSTLPWTNTSMWLS